MQQPQLVSQEMQEPQGQNYIQYENLQPFPANTDIQQLLGSIKANLAENVPWQNNLEALNALRQLNKFNTQHMNEICSLIWPSLVKCLSSVKTVMAKTSLMFMQELFHHCGANLLDAIIMQLEPAIAQKTQSPQMVLKQEAQKAYQILVEKVVKDATIVAIANTSRNKNPHISELSYKALERQVTLVGGSLTALQPLTFKELFLVVMQGLDGKRAEVQKSSENIVKLLYQGLGDSNFSVLVTAMLNEQVLKQEDMNKLRKVFEVKDSKPKEHLSDVLKQAKMQKQMEQAQMQYGQINSQAQAQMYNQTIAQQFQQLTPEQQAAWAQQLQQQYYQG